MALAVSREFPSVKIGNATLVNADCFDWLESLPPNSVHAIVTDPPYGVKEYEDAQMTKRAKGSGGIWRMPPSFDGCTRAPLPRFTALNTREREAITSFFTRWSAMVNRVLVPGGHVFIATNTFLSQIVFAALTAGGLEFRGQLVRVVRTLRGGDRPKNAEAEFPDVSSMPKGCHEPWGLFRSPLPTGMTVSECLRKYKTGGIRRTVEGKPLDDLIFSERTPRREREIANHPSLKPQSLMRTLVYVALPLGEGIVADPFMGSGSTVAAAEAMGVRSIGVERSPEFYAMAIGSVPQLSRLEV